MERILHRVNTIDRLRRGVEAGFDRLEIDLHRRGGRFLLSHDPPVGPVAVGRVGVEFPRAPWSLVQWQGSFLELADVLGAKPPPLYVDLKGLWTEDALRVLCRELDRHGRDADVVGSNRWLHGERAARVAPDRRFVFGVSERTFPRLERCIRDGELSFGISLSAGSVGARGAGFVRNLCERGIAVYVWDVRDPRKVLQLERLGAAGVIVDALDWARRRRDAEAL